MIKNIIFDFGDIFINLDKEATLKALAKFGIHEIGKESMKVAYRYEEGKISTEDFVAFFSRQLKITKKDLIVAWNAILLDFPKDRLAFLKKLAESKKYRLFLLSNTNDLHISWIQNDWGEELYNEFKNNPNVVSHTVKLNTILKSLVAIRGLQLELSNKQFENGVEESKEYLNEVITGNESYFDIFEEDFEETELKEEFVWFPQLFTHNTTIEVVWTIIPALILVCIAIPSFSLLYAMDQIWQPLFTIKVLGNQWYWSYEYC